MKIFQVPATISQVKTMASGLRVSVDTQDNLSPDAISRVFQMKGGLGWFTFNQHIIEPDDIIDLPKLKRDDKQKTPSERLRAVLYIYWQQDNHGYEDSELFYRYYVEKVIDAIKDKLND